MTVSIGKTFTFEAAHRLPGHEGKCRNLHGHSYRVEVNFYGSVSVETGMVLDFDKIKEWWKTLEPQLDHATILFEDDPLADLLLGCDIPLKITAVSFLPTAENLADWIRANAEAWLDQFRDRQQPMTFVDSVKVWETATSWAEA